MSKLERARTQVHDESRDGVADRLEPVGAEYKIRRQGSHYGNVIQAHGEETRVGWKRQKTRSPRVPGTEPRVHYRCRSSNFASVRLAGEKFMKNHNWRKKKEKKEYSKLEFTVPQLVVGGESFQHLDNVHDRLFTDCSHADCSSESRTATPQKKRDAKIFNTRHAGAKGRHNCRRSTVPTQIDLVELRHYAGVTERQSRCVNQTSVQKVFPPCLPIEVHTGSLTGWTRHSLSGAGSFPTMSTHRGTNWASSE